MRYVLMLLLCSGCAQGAYQNTVIVRSFHSDGPATCTGVIYKGRIVTCAHCVEDALSVSVEFFDGTKYNAKVLRSNEREDWAILFVPRSLKGVRAGKAPKAGDPIYQVGAPNLLYFSYARGYVMFPIRKLWGSTYIQADLTTYGGNSGSGVFNRRGELIGITSRVITGTSISFLVPISLVEVSDERRRLHSPTTRKTGTTQPCSS